MISSVFAQYPEVQFRLQKFRHQHSLDHIPTQDKAVSLGQMPQAELQALENASPHKKTKLARVQEGQDSMGEGSGGKAGTKNEAKGKGNGKRGGRETKPERS